MFGLDISPQPAVGKRGPLTKLGQGPNRTRLARPERALWQDTLEERGEPGLRKNELNLPPGKQGPRRRGRGRSGGKEQRGRTAAGSGTRDAPERTLGGQAWTWGAG